MQTNHDRLVCTAGHSSTLLRWPAAVHGRAAAATNQGHTFEPALQGLQKRLADTFLTAGALGAIFGQVWEVRMAACGLLA